MGFNRAITAMARPFKALVHPVAAAAGRERAKHEWFIATRLALGAVGLGSIPLMLVTPNRVGPAAAAAVLCCALQAAMALVVSRSGELRPAYLFSAATLASGAVGLAVLAGGFDAPVLALLPALVVEAGFLTGTAGLVATTLFAGAAVAALAVDARAGVSALVQPFVVLAGAALSGLYALWENGQRVAAERHLAAHATLVANGFGDLVTRHDAQGLVLATGEGARDVLGAPPSTLLGRGLFERVHIADRPAFLKAVTDAAARGGAVEAAVRIRLGGELGGEGAAAGFGWFELRAHAFAVEGQPVEIVCGLRDVSARREHDERLEQARIDAQAANELKTGFLAMASHELRTPLSAIIGFSEMLADPDGPLLGEARRRDYATIVQRSGAHLLNVVNALLDVSRIETGAYPLDPEPVDLAEAFDEVAALMDVTARKADVSLDMAVEPGLPCILADRGACRRVLENLVGNAIKFTRTGGRVQAFATRDLDSVVLVVEDNGVGIAADEQGRLGEPFYRASHGTEKIEGSGLGLSVVKGLVGLHGGEMRIVSAPGVGTTVTVRLPIALPAGRPRAVSMGLATLPPKPAGIEPGPVDAVRRETPILVDPVKKSA